MWAERGRPARGRLRTRVSSIGVARAASRLGGLTSRWAPRLAWSCRSTVAQFAGQLAWPAGRCLSWPGHAGQAGPKAGLRAARSTTPGPSPAARPFAVPAPQPLPAPCSAARDPGNTAASMWRQAGEVPLCGAGQGHTRQPRTYLRRSLPPDTDCPPVRERTGCSAGLLMQPRAACSR